MDWATQTAKKVFVNIDDTWIDVLCVEAVQPYGDNGSKIYLSSGAVLQVRGKADDITKALCQTKQPVA